MTPIRDEYQVGSLLGCPVDEQRALCDRVAADLQTRDADIVRMAKTYPHKDAKAVRLWEIAAQHARLRESFAAYRAYVIRTDSRWICDDVKSKCADTDRVSAQLHADAVSTYGRGRPLPPSPTDKDKGGGPLISISSPHSPLFLIGAGAAIAYLLSRR